MGRQKHDADWGTEETNRDRLDKQIDRQTDKQAERKRIQTNKDIHRPLSVRGMKM